MTDGALLTGASPIGHQQVGAAPEPVPAVQRRPGRSFDYKYSQDELVFIESGKSLFDKKLKCLLRVSSFYPFHCLKRSTNRVFAALVPIAVEINRIF